MSRLPVLIPVLTLATVLMAGAALASAQHASPAATPATLPPPLDA